MLREKSKSIRKKVRKTVCHRIAKNFNPLEPDCRHFVHIKSSDHPVMHFAEPDPADGIRVLNRHA